MTKTEEIELLNKFAAGLSPGTYLQAIFREVVPIVSDAIRNDFCVIPLADLWAQKAQTLAELQSEKGKLDARIAELKSEVRSLEWRAGQAKSDLVTVRAEALRLTRA